MKKIAILFIVILFLINSCSNQVICSTPYILGDGECCLDSDSDGKCDTKIADTEDRENNRDIEEGQDIKQSEIKKPKEILIPETKSVKEVVNDVGGDLYIGSLDSNVIIISYGDYEDKFSQRFNNEVLPKIIERYGDKILYIYKDFPNYEHRLAFRAAEAANCAKDQGKFLEYHNILFNNINHLLNEDLINYAKELNLDINEFRGCLNFGKYAEDIRQDIDNGNSIGITTTPTVFINGLKIFGFREFDVYRVIIDNLLRFKLPGDIIYERALVASSSGKVYLIHKDKSALDETILESPYTNKVDLAEGRFSLEILDKTVEKTKFFDEAKFDAEIKIKKYGELIEEVYKVKLKELEKEEKYEGGVVTDVYINGRSKFGTKQLPRVLAYMSLWGKADVYDRNNNLILNNADFNFAITQGMRENGLIFGDADKTDTEAYLFIFGIFGKDGTAFPNEDGFLYTSWENLYYSVR